MKAGPGDFRSFEAYLRRLAQFGNCQSQETACEARKILDVLEDAITGTIGRECACGRKGVVAKKVQPAPTWPVEAHVVCKEHAALIDQFQAFMKTIVEEDKK
jgi:hypothetical protein